MPVGEPVLGGGRRRPGRQRGENEGSLTTIEGMTMLVLSRKKNESIVINNDITIVVVEIRGDKVRLGVEAPKEVPVHRREVYDAIKRNEAAQNGSAATEAGSNTASPS